MANKIIRKKVGGRLLSWHKGVKQWYLAVPVFQDGQVQKKRKYFGTGTGKSDMQAYRKALAKYQAYMDEWEAFEARRAFLARMESQEHGTTVIEQWLEKHRPDSYTPEQDRPAGKERKRRERSALLLQGLEHKSVSLVAPADVGESVSDHIDQWLLSQKSRENAGVITFGAYESKRKGIKTFREFTSGRAFGTEQEVERVLGDYREYLLGKFAGRSFSAYTVNDKLKFLGQFITWAWENRVLEDNPRSLRRVVAKLPVEKEGKPLPLETVRAIWSQANPRMKCFIALGLNCGFKNKDISSLRQSDLRDGRLVSRRSKTKAPMNYLLWDVTQRLIEETRQDEAGNKDALLFTATNGLEIPTGTITSLFKKVAVRADATVGVTIRGNTAYATFEQLRDTGTERIQISLAEQGKDASTLQRYLAQKDTTNASHYTTKDPEQYRSAILDEETQKLEVYFGLYL